MYMRDNARSLPLFLGEDHLLPSAYYAPYEENVAV
jgi:hypothetical protein